MKAKPLASWSEDDGPALWWRFPVQEPPYVGTPNDLGYQVVVVINGKAQHLDHVGGFPDYVTHWTDIALPDDVPKPL